MGEQYLIHGAFIKCSAGTVPSQIRVTSHSSIYIQGLQVATEQDKQPMVNIQTFGVCSFTQKPCIPAPIVWESKHEEVEISGHQSLTLKSCINCSIGGKIDPVISGQTPSPAAPLLNNNSPDFNPVPTLGFVVSAPALAEAAVATEAVVETSLAAEVAMGTLATAGVLAADDVTVVGVVDDVAIPVVLVVGLVAAGAIALWSLFDDEPAPAPAPAIPIPIPAPAYPPSGIVETEPDPITIPVPITIPKTDAIPKEKTKEQDPCEPIPLGYHRGGSNTLHNRLADYVPPNRQPWGDWVVKGKAFDALSVSNILWEIKAWFYSTYTDGLKEIRLLSAKADIAVEWPIATECGYGYKMGVIDSNMKTDLDRSDFLIARAGIVEVIWFAGKPRPDNLP